METTTPDPKSWAVWIRAFEIFARYSDYANLDFEHDEMFVSVSPQSVSAHHRRVLKSLGWEVNKEHDCFCRFR